jgi:formate dehydrogenase major subunit
MALNTLDYPVNRVTSSFVDRSTHTPAFKETSVQMRILGKRENPLPSDNFRYGHPTPQNGVEVERKWKQPSYSLPGNKLVHIETATRLALHEKSDSI